MIQTFDQMITEFLDVSENAAKVITKLDANIPYELTEEFIVRQVMGVVHQVIVDKKAAAQNSSVHLLQQMATKAVIELYTELYSEMALDGVIGFRRFAQEHFNLYHAEVDLKSLLNFAK